jgi:CRP/FNR family transcriptional regulator, cyclic AMP receptor protein
MMGSADCALDEYPLAYLPRKAVEFCAKGRIIYDMQHPPSAIFVVIQGRVKVSSTANDGCETVGRIVRAEGLLGESCLLGHSSRNEVAMALDDVTLMSWSCAEIEQQVEREPGLGIALFQCFVREGLELQDRVESMAIYKTPERVMLALLQLAAELGTLTPDGGTRMVALPHHTIAEFVGTSREIVTFQMNRLRRLGLIRYSRKYMDIYMHAMRETLNSQGITIPGRPLSLGSKAS